MTPRQFEALYKARLSDDGSTLRYMKDQSKAEFVSNRDLIRLLDEHKEAARRRNVLEGKWTEEESVAKMEVAMREVASKVVDPETEAKKRQDMMEVFNFFKNIHNPHKIFEKEYYFDENLG